MRLPINRVPLLTRYPLPATREDYMRKIEAKGRLYHHFHGDYWYTINLVFDSPADAIEARNVLGVAWARPDTHPMVLVCQGSGDELGPFLATTSSCVTINPCGHSSCKPRGYRRGQGPDAPRDWPCKARSINALTHSVDCGPVFTLARSVKEEFEAQLENARHALHVCAEPALRETVPMFQEE